MKRILILTMVLLGGACESSRASLGATVAKTELVYDKPVYTKVDGGKECRTYLIGNNHLLVTYVNGVSVLETVSPLEKTAKLSDEECVDLAKVMVGDTLSEWAARPEMSDAANTYWSMGREYYAVRAQRAGVADMLTVRAASYKSGEPATERHVISAMRLGATMAEVEAKYGKAIGTNFVPGLIMRQYRQGSNALLVTYLNNVSASEGLMAADGTKDLSDAECLAFAAAVTGKTNWVEFKSRNEREKDWSVFQEFYACKNSFRKDPDTFGVMNKAIVDYTAALSKEDAKFAAERYAAEAAANPGKTPATGESSASAAGGSKILKMQQEWAAQGDAYGEYKMGTRYLNGDGVEKDAAKGRELLKKSAAQGYKEAVDALAKLPKE